MSLTPEQRVALTAADDVPAWRAATIADVRLAREAEDANMKGPGVLQAPGPR